VPFVHKEVVMRLGSLVSYPLVAHGSAVENATVMHIIAIVSGILGFMLMYALPKSLYAPSTRSLVVATNIYATMYCAFYTSAADLVKMALWAVTGSLVLPTIFGLIMIALTFAFPALHLAHHPASALAADAAVPRHRPVVRLPARLHPGDDGAAEVRVRVAGQRAWLDAI
jgi:hypothetical protein